MSDEVLHQHDGVSRLDCDSTAAFFSIGLRASLVDPSEVSVWADGMLRRIETPDPSLCELALASDVEEQISLLNALRGGADLPTVFEALMRRLRAWYERGAMDLRQTIGKLAIIASEFESKEDLRIDALTLDDELADANAGIVRLETVRAGLQEVFDQNIH